MSSAPWTRERRTLHEYLEDLGAELGGVAAMAREFEIPVKTLQKALHRGTGFRPETVQKIREHAGIPAVAFVFLDQPIGKLVIAESKLAKRKFAA